jgi:hypothetical protein
MREGGSRPSAAAGDLLHRISGIALAMLLAGCSTAPPASPGTTSHAPSALESAPPSASVPASTATPSAAPTAQPPASPDPDLGSFEVLRAPARAGFAGRIVCTGSLGQSDPVALVNLKGSGEQAVLRDYADVTHPRTACTFTGVRVQQLIDPRHVVVVDDESRDLYAVVDLPDVRYRWFQLPKSTTDWGVELITVGPDLDRVVWEDVHVKNTDTDVIYLTTKSATVKLATLPDTNQGRCGSPTDSIRGQYTPSGSYLYVLNQPILSNHSLLVFKDRETLLSIAPPHVEWAGENAPYHAVWSPASPTLYWTQKGDVWRWTPDGGQQRFITGVAWFDPTISADGRYLAYSAPRSDGKLIVFLVDLTGDAVPHKIGDGPRAQPRFLNSTQLWWQREGGGCTGPLPTPRIYNVTDGSEDGSIIERVQATWPAMSARF